MALYIISDSLIASTVRKKLLPCHNNHSAQLSKHIRDMGNFVPHFLHFVLNIID
jgi:hypothetical protein